MNSIIVTLATILDVVALFIVAFEPWGRRTVVRFAILFALLALLLHIS